MASGGKKTGSAASSRTRNNGPRAAARASRQNGASAANVGGAGARGRSRAAGKAAAGGAAAGKASAGKASASKAAANKANPTSKMAMAPGLREPVLSDKTRRLLIAGVVGVCSILLFVFVVAPQGGIVSDAIGGFMRLAFGSLSWVAPILVLIWAAVFYLKDDLGDVIRAGAGLGVALIAMCAFRSTLMLQADADLSLLFLQDNVLAGGGWIGAGVAWLLTICFGRTIAMIVFVLLLFAGIVLIAICARDTLGSLWQKAMDKRVAPPAPRKLERMPSNPYDDVPVRFDANGDVLQPQTAYPGAISETTGFDGQVASRGNARRSGDRNVAEAYDDVPYDDDRYRDDMSYDDGRYGDERYNDGYYDDVFYGDDFYGERPYYDEPYGGDRRAQGLRGGDTLAGRPDDDYDDLGFSEPPASYIKTPKPLRALFGAWGLGKRRKATSAEADEELAGDGMRDGTRRLDDGDWRVGGDPTRGGACDYVGDGAWDYRYGDAVQYDDAEDIANAVPIAGPTIQLAGEGDRYLDLYTSPVAGATIALSDADAAPAYGTCAYGEEPLRGAGGDVAGEFDGDVVGASSALGEADKGPANSKRRAARGRGSASRARSAAPKAQEAPPEDDAPQFALPPTGLLKVSGDVGVRQSRRNGSLCEQMAGELQSALDSFSVDASVRDWVQGPTVTQFRIDLAPGVRVSRITGLQDDIALALAAEAVRVLAPIPGTSYVGVEVPNASRSNVRLGDVLSDIEPTAGPLTMALGKDVEGNTVIADLAKMPHLLIAGTTGSGKSVAENSMIISMLMRAKPDELRMIMVDPKRVELSVYKDIPHLYVPPVTEPGQAASALLWSTAEMDKRFKIIQKAGARNIDTYNNMVARGDVDDPGVERMPYLVIVIDELADLMMQAKKDVESSICRIAQLGRAAGVHLIIATQRPSTDIVTGLIKANIANRMALKVSSSIDSRVILDQPGAERLLGNGDMLVLLNGWTRLRRVQGCWLEDSEIYNICKFLKEQGAPDYHDDILHMHVGTGYASDSEGGAGVDAAADDPLVWDAAEAVISMGFGSTSGLQRRLRVGYARAGRIMDMLEAKGIVGPPDGTKPREVLIDELELESLKAFEQSDAMRGGDSDW